jgi:RNA polymerase sigma-70 factor (ECF subfamily)
VVSPLARRLHALGENDLVPLAIAGNDAAFTRLYRRHAAYVAGALYRTVGGELDIDEVVAATFVEARRDLVRLREPDHLRGWLMEIALRQLVEHARKTDPEVELCDLLLRGAPIVWGAAASVVGQLRDAVDALPGRLKLPYVLQRLSEVPTSTIADLCGCSVRDVRRRIWAAEKQLRRQNLAVIADRVRLDSDIPWHDIREMRVLKMIRAVPVVRTGFAAIHEAAPSTGKPSLRERAMRYGALMACSAAVVGLGAWIGPVLRSVTG